VEACCVFGVAGVISSSAGVVGWIAVIALWGILWLWRFCLSLPTSGVDRYCGFNGRRTIFGLNLCQGSCSSAKTYVGEFLNFTLLSA